jgi:hypothetical protein
MRSASIRRDPGCSCLAQFYGIFRPGTQSERRAVSVRSILAGNAFEIADWRRTTAICKLGSARDCPNRGENGRDLSGPNEKSIPILDVACIERTGPRAPDPGRARMATQLLGTRRNARCNRTRLRTNLRLKARNIPEKLLPRGFDFAQPAHKSRLNDAPTWEILPMAN